MQQQHILALQIQLGGRVLIQFPRDPAKDKMGKPIADALESRGFERVSNSEWASDRSPSAESIARHLTEKCAPYGAHEVSASSDELEALKKQLGSNEKLLTELLNGLSELERELGGCKPANR